MISKAAALEAVLFAAGEPLSKKRLATLLEASPEELRDAALTLHAQLSDRGLALIEACDELHWRTGARGAPHVQKLRESELSRDLGKAGLETLSVILYKNGATRGEIDWIRGVNSTAALRSLTLRGLVVRSEDASDRRRMRYTATTEALAHLGVSSVSQLPSHKEFTEALGVTQQKTVAVENPELHDEE
jgi:segregation and condensation protein B